MINNPLYKKACFQAARRAMLENEYVIKGFVEKIVFENYSDEKLDRLNVLLRDIYDNDLFDIIMGVKQHTDFKDRYDQEILLEIENYSRIYREEAIKANIK